MSFFSALLAEGVQSGAAKLIARGNFTDAEKIIINDTFVKLQADEQLQYLYTAKVYGVSSEANSFLDWINDSGTYDAIKVGSPTFTQYHGWKGTGSTANYIRSGFNANGVVSINNCLFIGWELSDVTDSSTLFGANNGANEGILLIPKTASNTALSRLNSSANDSVAQTGRPVGFWTLERVLSTEYSVRTQNVVKASYAKSSSAVPNLEIYHLLANSSGSPGTAGTREIGAFVAAHGDGDYNLIADAFNDAVVRLHALSL